MHQRDADITITGIASGFIGATQIATRQNFDPPPPPQSLGCGFAVANIEPKKEPTIRFGEAEMRSKKGTIILISDLFVDRERLFKGLRLLQYRGHDVMLLHILDDQELDFNYGGTTRFEGMEEAGELVCDPRSLREGYLDAMQEFLNEIRRRCAKNQFDYQTIRTSEYLDAALAHYLNHRIGMQQSIRQ